MTLPTRGSAGWLAGMRWHLLLLTISATCVVPLRGADRAREIARIHVEAIGGRVRLEALKTLRIQGRAETPRGVFSFVLWAARPDHLRLETRFADRTVVQGSDGRDPPWEIDSARGPGPIAMAAAAARVFLADASFDDPLVVADRGPLAIEFGGEIEREGRRLLRVLAAPSLTENVFLLVDPETYLIIERRHVLRTGAERSELVARFDDYRPVRGVLIAHAVALSINGAATQRATFVTIDANPPIDEGFFRVPRSAP